MTFSETLFMFSRGRRFYEIVGKYYLLKTSTEQIFYSVWNRRRSVKLCSCFPDIEGFMRLRANTLSAQSRLVWVGLYKPDKLHNVFVQIDLFVKYEDFLESSRYTASLPWIRYSAFTNVILLRYCLWSYHINFSERWLSWKHCCIC